MRQLALVVDPNEQYRRHPKKKRLHQRAIAAASKEIREDTDPVTKQVKGIMSVRRLAKAEYEGLEFVRADKHDPKALRKLKKLWPGMWHGMAKRLASRGFAVVMAR